jgi:hypothetical protein
METKRKARSEEKKEKREETKCGTFNCGGHRSYINSHTTSG